MEGLDEPTAALAARICEKAAKMYWYHTTLPPAMLRAAQVDQQRRFQVWLKRELRKCAIAQALGDTHTRNIREG